MKWTGKARISAGKRAEKEKSDSLTHRLAIVCSLLALDKESCKFHWFKMHVYVCV